MSYRLVDAVSMAAHVHGGQLRKGTDVPYIAHLFGVAAIALEHGANENEACAALLHDAIEDAPTVLEAEAVRRWIGFSFGAEVLAIVEGCTDADTQPKPPWEERKRAYVEHVRMAGASVVRVSASDKLHNARAILRDFKVVGDAVWPRFRDAPEPKRESVVGYYRGLVQAFGASGHHPRLIAELESVVSEIEAATGVTGRWPLGR
ncbi:MAG: HD domain-containing protein [Vicinamibacterales bacterium]